MIRLISLISILIVGTLGDSVPPKFVLNEEIHTRTTAFTSLNKINLNCNYGYNIWNTKIVKPKSLGEVCPKVDFFNSFTLFLFEYAINTNCLFLMNCTVSVEPVPFCTELVKHIVLEYNCTKQVRKAEFNSNIQESYLNEEIKCSDGYTIDVNAVNWGEIKENCPNDPKLATTFIFLRNSILNSCQGARNCTINAKEHMLENTCDLDKFARIQYKCEIQYYTSTNVTESKDV